ncbi:MAG: putative Ig domain-containing protein, partial [Thermodesulfobacteriota bacterium]
IGNRQVNEGQLLQFTITASDPDNDALIYEASNLPTGAIFDPASQKFSWIPTYDQGGKSYPNIEFTVTDNGSPNELDFEVIEITVGNVNRAPVFSPLGTQCIPENQLLQFYVTATDPDGDAITYSTGPLPKGASFDASGGLFSWTPDSTQAGTYTVAFYAMDSGSPPMTGDLNVSINVGDVYTPCELADQIIQTVLSLNLRKSVENSYMANLKKVCKFVEDGKMIQAIVQLDVFIAKVVIDVVKHDISEAAGRSLINMAINLIKIIKS